MGKLLNFKNIEELETLKIKATEIKNLMLILAQNRFEKVLDDDLLIIYDYRNFNQMYGDLLNATIDKITRMISDLENSVKALRK